MVILSNDKMRVSISEIGAELRSILKDGKEYMWAGREEIWSGVAPIMFPICGGLRDDKYVLNGKEYTMPKHGFAKLKSFTVESKTDTSATLLLKEDEETLVFFPYKFELRVIYTLKESSLNIGFQVKNLNDDTMYFSIGSHEAYATPEGIEDYDVIFPEKETLSAGVLDGNLLGDNRVPIIKNSNYLPLYDKFFFVDALVFEGVKSRSVTLRNRKTEKEIRVDFQYCDYLLLWHKPMSPYICIEPWSGIQDSIHSNYDITNKKGIVSLASNGEYNNVHTVNIVK